MNTCSEQAEERESKTHPLSHINKPMQEGRKLPDILVKKRQQVMQVKQEKAKQSGAWKICQDDKEFK